MEDIISIAAKSKSFGLKGRAKYSFTLKNKNCGDEINIEFDLKNNKIGNFRYDGETCIYCQASAALLSKNTNKLTITKLQNLKNQIYNFFNGKINNQTLEIFDFKQLLKIEHQPRKECIALPVNAILNALKKNDY